MIFLGQKDPITVNRIDTLQLDECYGETSDLLSRSRT
jgi:hypothetical protein